MGNDPCTKDVWWSAINAASGDSTLAGVLAGLLIAAAAALLVGWYEGSDPHTIALFGSGVPALAFSTYLFTVIAGMSFPQKESPDFDEAAVRTVCSQMWSQWLLAMGLLFIGGAVLICGLGWALVSYADNLAVRLCRQPVPRIETVKVRRAYFIRLSGWLSGGIIATTTALLVPANVLYIKTIQVGFFKSAEVKWYTIFSVFMVGIAFISCSTYTAFFLTRSAQRANVTSCAEYAEYLRGDSLEAADPQPQRLLLSGSRGRRSRWLNDWRTTRAAKNTLRAAREVAAVLWVALGASLAVHMTFRSAGKPSWVGPSAPQLVLLMVDLYLTARITYPLVVRIGHRSTGTKDDASDNPEPVAVGDTEPAQRIRIKYSVGKLSTATRSVVGLAIVAAFFDVALTQGAFGTPQNVMSLFLGGLCPAAILTALSFSIPATDDGRGLRTRGCTDPASAALVAASGRAEAPNRLGPNARQNARVQRRTPVDDCRC